MRVFGLVVGTHVIADIGMAIPHGREVLIPGDKVVRSRDLQRALTQKCVFQLPPNPPQHVAPPTHVRDDVLQERVRSLEVQNKHLQEENDQLRESLRGALAHQGRLDTILEAIQQAKLGPLPGSPGAQTIPAPRDELADGTAPQFIPDTIAPKDAEIRIDVVKHSADSSVSDAAEKLRKMRRGPG